VSFTITVGLPRPWPTITTASLPTAVQNVSYSYQLNATGGVGPYTWQFTQYATVNLGGTPTTLGRPIWGGLGLSTDGMISGTPAYEIAPPPATVYLMVTDAFGATATAAIPIGYQQ